MTALLEAELVKLRTTRTFLLLVLAALGITLLITVLNATLRTDLTESDVRDFALSDTSSLFILILAVVGMTGEWRHRTIAGSLLAAPDRVRFLAAKVIAYAVAGVVLSLVVNLASAAVSTVILSARDEVTVSLGDFLDLLWRNLVLAGCFGALGVAIGALVRNQPTAIVGVLIAMLVVEPVVFAAWPGGGKFGPLIGAPSGFAGLDDDPDELAPGVAVLVELAWIAALAGLASVLLRRRDVV